MGILSSIKGAVTKALDTATAAFVHPIQTVTAIVSPTKTIAQVTQAHFEQPLKKQITETLLTTAGYIGAATGINSLVTKGAAALIPATAKGKIIAGTAAVLGTGAIIKEPSTLLKAASLPSEIAEFGGGIATFVANPSIETGKELLKESPILSSVAAGAAVIAVGAGVSNLVSGTLTRNEMEKQTAALQEQTKILASNGGNSNTQLIKEKDLGKAENIPIQETMNVTSSKTRRKRRTAKKTPSVRQSVRINILNKNSSTGIKSTNKRYLNERLFN